jgi:hypothetical protein
MKRLLIVVTALALLGALLAMAQTRPKSVIHIVNVKWKAEATPAQIQEALDRCHQLPAKYNGITRVWTKVLSYQAQREGYTHAIVMEFRDEEALKKYADSDVQKWWYEKYIPIRDQSQTHDITN